MNAKYADVVKTSEVIAFFDSLPSDLFELPESAPAAAAAAQAGGRISKGREALAGRQAGASLTMRIGHDESRAVARARG